MSRVLLAGVGPMPHPDLKKVYAPGLRLDAFRRALVDGGHEVHLAEMRFGGGAGAPGAPSPSGLAGHTPIPGDPAEAATILTRIAEEWRPDAAVALTDAASLALATSHYSGPLHVDYFGHPMAERQQQAHVHDSDEGLAAQWLHVLPVLLRADRFSVNSPSQRLALVGELGAAGRLNSGTCHSELIDVIPPAIPFAEPFTLGDPGLLGRLGVPEGARVVLSTGGFNTWVDEETLFAGLERAMEEDPRLHFVATGGRIEGHVAVVFERFEDRAAASRFRERFHLVGWLPHRELEDLMQLAEVAVNCDRWSLEGELGCRNRLFGWLWAGLRVVTTVSSDPTRDLVAQGLVQPVPERHPEALAAALVEAAAAGRPSDPERIREQLRRDWFGTAPFEPLLSWLQSPTPAADRGEGQVQNPLALLQRRLLREAEQDATARELQRTAKELADRLEGSRLFRLFARLRPETGELVKRLRKL